MASNEKKRTRKGLIGAAALLLLLVVFPLVSWFYLQQGLDYRISALEQLKDHGKAPAFELVNYKLDTLRRDDLEGNVVVTSFINLENDTLAALYGEKLSKLHHQFDERPDLLFLQHLLGKDTSAERLNAFEINYELTDESQVYFLIDGKPSVQQLAQEGYSLPLEGTDLMDNPYMALLDTMGTIRRYYDVRDEEEIKQLVAHIALILPQIKERDLVFRREIEK